MSRKKITNKELSSIIRLLAKHTKRLPVPVVEQVAASKKPYRVLISTMLSPRTKDEETGKASMRLFKVAPNMAALSQLAVARLAKIIYPVGFYRTKAKHLKKAAIMINEKYGGTIPKTIDELMLLPGVGRKVAALVVSLSYGVPAICVDTHVHRISNRLGLVQTHHPHETEQALMQVLPKKYWISWNMWLVMWGQNICTPQSPKCSKCPLNAICPKVGVTQTR